MTFPARTLQTQKEGMRTVLSGYDRLVTDSKVSKCDMGQSRDRLHGKLFVINVNFLCDCDSEDLQDIGVSQIKNIFSEVAIDMVPNLR